MEPVDVLEDYLNSTYKLDDEYCYARAAGFYKAVTNELLKELDEETLQRFLNVYRSRKNGS